MSTYSRKPQPFKEHLGPCDHAYLSGYNFVKTFTRGIPQVSLLAPLLFNIFPSIFNCTKYQPTIPLPKTFTDLVFSNSCTCTGTRSWDRMLPVCFLEFFSNVSFEESVRYRICSRVYGYKETYNVLYFF